MAGSRLAAPHSSKTVAPAGISTPPRAVSYGTKRMWYRNGGSKRESLLHEHRNQIRILTQFILKVSMFREDAHSIPKKARGGFAAGAQQGVENAVGFSF